MFETTSRIAEKLATSVSRRGFLGSVGRWAGAAALGLAGVLTTVGTARADSRMCCIYWCLKNGLLTSYHQCGQGIVCDPPKTGCALYDSRLVSDCQQCGGKKGTGGGA